MAIPRADFWSFIIGKITRNPAMAVPALEDGPFVNFLIFDSLYVSGRIVGCAGCGVFRGV